RQKKRKLNVRPKRKRHSRKPKRRLLNSVRRKKRKLSVRQKKKRRSRKQERRLLKSVRQKKRKLSVRQNKKRQRRKTERRKVEKGAEQRSAEEAEAERQAEKEAAQQEAEEKAAEQRAAEEAEAERQAEEEAAQQEAEEKAAEQRAAEEAEAERQAEQEAAAAEEAEDDSQAPSPASYGENWYLDGDCTWYVYERRQQMGKPVSNQWGNASNWASAAKSQGLNVSSSPSVGAIVQSNAWTNGAWGSGHVAVVEKVNSDGSILVSEMNWSGGPGNKTMRTIGSYDVSSHNFIH